MFAWGTYGSPYVTPSLNADSLRRGKATPRDPFLYCSATPSYDPSKFVYSKSIQKLTNIP